MDWSVVENPTRRRPQSLSGFEIATLCALPIEADAVISLFDAYMDDDIHRYDKAPGDPNAYTRGRIGRHNVVVVHMPDMGKVSAAVVGLTLRSTFRDIKLALIVGVCGGVPYDQRTKRDIFLGDVLISRSLIQYDFGRQYTTDFKAKDSLQGGSGKASAEILAILAKLTTAYNHDRLQRKAKEILNDLQQTNAKARYPGPNADRLFDFNTVHMHRQTGVCQVCRWEQDQMICDVAVNTACKELGCDDAGLRRVRSARKDVDESTSFSPSIHIGPMGSADTVMKSATHRDEIASKYNVIGFEMEGAGVWDYIPSLVIKSVCDYADSHKNNSWQVYAANTAAAAAKAFLGEWNS